ncbi:MAG: AI-2E family transporter [Gammaproteobacteria bacterium]|nr:AI-2E family transporter [Gammaproteobacteria bacterium]MCZ6911567.1 AI-2E family transporter [Pseudomonadota bacterium]
MGNSESRFHTMLMLAAFIVVVAGMKAASPILVPFLLSLFLAVITAPPMFWLRNHGVPNWLALLAVVAIIVVVGIGLGAVVSRSIGDFSRDLPLYQARLAEISSGLVSLIDRLGLDVSTENLQDLLNPGRAMSLAAGVLAGLGSVLTNAFLILLTVTFMLLEAGGFATKLHIAFPGPQGAVSAFEGVSASINKYVGLKSLISLVTAILIIIWLTILGVDYPLLWGLLAFFFNFVPNIGSIIAAVPAVLLAIVQLGVSSAILTAGGYLAVNILLGSVLEPRLLGRTLGISPLIIFLSLVFWGWVLGPVGMLLSVPLTMIARIILSSSEQTQWIAIMMGPEPGGTVAKESPGDQKAGEEDPLLSSQKDGGE